MDEVRFGPRESGVAFTGVLMEISTWRFVAVAMPLRGIVDLVALPLRVVWANGCADFLSFAAEAGSLQGARLGFGFALGGKVDQMGQHVSGCSGKHGR